MDIKILEKSLAGQQFVLGQSKDPVQIERVTKTIAKLEKQMLELKVRELTVENGDLRKQLKNVCNALMERKLT
jgi:hypothetical protein